MKLFRRKKKKPKETENSNKKSTEEKGFKKLKSEREKKTKKKSPMFASGVEETDNKPSLFGVMEKNQSKKSKTTFLPRSGASHGGGLGDLIAVASSSDNGLEDILENNREEHEINIPGEPSDEYLREFIIERDGNESKLDELKAFELEKQREEILSFRIMKFNRERMKKLVMKNVQRFKEEEIEFVTLNHLSRVREVLEKFSIEYLISFITEDQNGVLKVKEVLETVFLSKLKLSRNDYFELEKIDEDFLMECILIFKFLLRDKMGVEEIIGNGITYLLFLMLNCFKHKKQIKLRSAIFSVLEGVMNFGDEGVLAVVSALNEYERLNCKEDGLNKFTEFVEVMNLSKSQAYLRFSFTFLNSLLTRIGGEVRKNYLNELDVAKFGALLEKLKNVKRIRNEKLREEVEIYLANIDKVAHLKVQNKKLLEEMSENKSIEFLEYLHKTLLEIKENPNEIKGKEETSKVKMESDV